ncbi:MAG: CRTAC1 family protein [Acidobacteriota bacterium]
MHRARFVFALAAIVTVAAVGPPSNAQSIYTQEVDLFGPAIVAPTVGPIPAPGIVGVGEVDFAGSSRPELLLHDGTVITWFDLDIPGAGSGTLTPAAPAPIVALVGMQVIGTTRPELVLLSPGSATSSDIWLLDLAAATPAWAGPFPLGFVANGMANADVVGTTAEDLVLASGTTLVAFDFAAAAGPIPLASPPLTLVDSINALDIGNTFPPTVGFRLLAANGPSAIGPVSLAFDKVTGTWFPVIIQPRFRIASSAPADLDGLAPTTGSVVLPTATALPLSFTDIAAGAAVFAGTVTPGGDLHCPGAVFTDLNGDSNPDLYLARGIGGSGSTNQLYFGDGLGGFTQQTTLGGLDTGNGSGALALDYDNDGLMDLYVLNMDGDNQLYRQFVNGTFRNVTASTDPTPLDPPGDLQEGLRLGLPDLAGGGRCPPTQPTCELNDSLTAAAGDFNRDGLADIFVANHLCCGFAEGERDILYLQGAGGTFTDITVAAGIASPTAALHDSSQSVHVVDVNNDLWPDIYVAIKVDGPPRDKLFINDGGTGGAWSGTFTEWFSSQPNGTLGNVTPAAMGVDFADVDNDGDLDWVVSDITNPLVASPGTSMDFYLNGTGPGPGTFSASLPPINPVASPGWSWGVHFADYDNDGDVELHMSTNPSVMDWFWRNDGGGLWADVAFDAGVGLAADTRANIPADLDRDGRVDMLVVDRVAPVSLFQNRSTTTNNWLEVQVIGNPALPPAPYRSTAGAIGARIDLTAGGVTQRRDIAAGGITCGSTRDYVAHFGVGTATTVSQVVVSFPSGRTRTLSNVAANQVVTISE